MLTPLFTPTVYTFPMTNSCETGIMDARRERALDPSSVHDVLVMWI